MDNPNTIWDLRIPGWTQYRDALELGVSKGLAGEAPPQAALDEAAQNFTQITNRLGGPKKQMENYKAAIGAK
jgi:multiple sugar transport system substrate-binding protein